MKDTTGKRSGRTTSYYLPDDLKQWLEKRASKEGRSESNLLAFIVRKAKEAAHEENPSNT